MSNILEFDLNKFISFLAAAFAWFAVASAYAAADNNSSIETVLSEVETAHLVFMREEEKLARDTYLTLNDLWGLRVFANISRSEQMHMNTMLTTINTYGLDDPVIDDAVGSFTNTTLAGMYLDLVAVGETSLLDALYVGALIEEVDMRDIQVAINETSQSDIIAAYESLLAGSTNHFRTFVGQIELQGVDYVAQVLDQSEVDSILGKTSADVFEINAGLNDAWYYPETNGQGFFITVYPDLGLISLAWFTYETQRPAADVEAVLGDAGHRWLTAIGPYSANQAQLEISITAGGVFDSVDPQPINTPDGTIMLHFNNCNSGTVSYDIPSISRTGEVPIVRVAADNIALCEALIEPSN